MHLNDRKNLLYIHVTFIHALFIYIILRNTQSNLHFFILFIEVIILSKTHEGQSKRHIVKKLKLKLKFKQPTSSILKHTYSLENNLQLNKGSFAYHTCLFQKHPGRYEKAIVSYYPDTAEYNERFVVSSGIRSSD